MTRATYADVPEHLRLRTPFVANSMRGVFHDSATANRLGRDYEVYSYGTMIAYVDTKGAVWLNQRKYSHTTTRQQNLCREHL